MNQKDYVANLQENIKQLNLAKDYLVISYERCLKLFPNKEPMENDLIELEALTSRFARVTDMLIHKVFRSIDAVEFLDSGTLLDTINRAEKRHLIDSADEIRLIKDLRNEIAHEYVVEELWLLHQEVLTFVPKVLDFIQHTTQYAARY